MERWLAPTADGPVDAVVRIPGSKSQTNRALVIAALADRPSVLHQPLRARDTRLMVDALSQLGATITAGTADGDDAWHVTPRPVTHGDTVDCGLAGTVMRFVPPVATLAPTGSTRFDGDPRAYARPIGAIIDALRQLGARVDDGGRRTLPFAISRADLRGGVVTVDAAASSQFISGLLLTAPRWDKGVEIHHVGPPLPSLPHIAMTVDELRNAGAEVDATEANVWRLAPGPLSGREITIEPDLSNAAPFLAAALVTGGHVTIRDWPERTTQPGDAVRDLLAAMGATVGHTADGLTVDSAGSIDGIDADLGQVSELLTVVAALAALARTPSRLRGVGHVRGHEADRLAALATELTALGGDVDETGDGLVIRPRPLHGGTFRTYDDHRLATAAAVLGLATPGIEIENVGATAKTLPDFTDRWLRMLGRAS